MAVQIVRAIAERLDRYGQAKIPTEIAPNDDMLDAEHPGAFEAYMAVGVDAIDLIAEAMIAGGIESAPSVLDLPCGFGRVTRHLAAFLPDSELFVCDLQTEGVEFCTQQLGATPLEASEDFDSLDFGRTFDLIWSGSLLTHLDATRFAAALKFFARSLSPNGIAVVTLHGRYSPFLQHHRWKYCSDARFEIAEAEFTRDGFGYVDYEGQDGYGVSLSAPSFSARLVEGMEDVRLIGYHERRWNDHQDVLVLRKAPIFA